MTDATLRGRTRIASAPQAAEGPFTALDDRLLYLTRDEAKALLDECVQRRGIAISHDPLRIDDES